VTYLENTAAMNRCTTMHLEVATENDSAHQLYLALGYADIGVRANYYGTGRDALMMSKQLQAGA
jgi:ribosomal protein S18 acetylase RimI-like enzyme